MSSEDKATVFSFFYLSTPRSPTLRSSLVRPGCFFLTAEARPSPDCVSIVTILSGQSNSIFVPGSVPSVMDHREPLQKSLETEGREEPRSTATFTHSGNSVSLERLKVCLRLRSLSVFGGLSPPSSTTDPSMTAENFQRADPPST